MEEITDEITVERRNISLQKGAKFGKHLLVTILSYKSNWMNLQALRAYSET